MNDRDLMTLPGWKQRDMVVSGELSSRELVEASLRRIEALDDRIHAFVTVDQEGALAAADAADAAVRAASNPASELGPFHGVPISIKDLEPTKGLRTMMGSVVYRDWVPDYDSVVVERVRGSGAVIVGKTNTPEFGNLGETYTKIAPTCNNPWDLTRIPGGSSGGAAASVAAAMTSIASASDGGGSTRGPAGFCGLSGIKATHGRVPRYGGIGRPTVNLIAGSGPITRHVRDTAILLQALSGHDPRDPISLRGPVPDFVGGLDDGVRGLRVGYGVEFDVAVADPDVDAAVKGTASTFEELGANVEEAPVRFDPQPADFYYPVWIANQVAMYGHLFKDHLEDLMPYTVRLNYFGVQITGAEVNVALGHADRLRSRLADYFEEFDLLLLPTTYVTAYRHQKPPDRVGGRPVLMSSHGSPYGVAPFTMAFNISWNPAASVPCGFDRDGLPIGLQIVGAIGDDATVLKAAAAFEAARPWADKLPPVS